MHAEQRLTTCEVCCRVLAVQYLWGGRPMAALASERIWCRWFQCPACGHQNPLLIFMYAHSFVVKVVPGPEVSARVHPNRLRRFWLDQDEQLSAPGPLDPPWEAAPAMRLSSLSLVVPGLLMWWRRYEQFLVWAVARL